MESMKRQCRACGTVYDWPTSSCDACGCNFAEEPARDRYAKWPYYLGAAGVGFLVAVLQYMLAR